LPGTNQTVFITNSGVKVVTIGPGTAENFPDSLSMDFLKISSPTNSANILLLNYAGFNNPLIAKQLWVSSNSIMLVYSSSLQISDLAAIEGTLIQDAGSQVSNRYTPVVGSYSLNSGTFRGAILNIYGNGRFTQSGGTNFAALDIPWTYGAAEYDLNGGEFDGEISIGFTETFRQNGGVANIIATNGLQIEGQLIQSGGIFNGPTNSRLTIPDLLDEFSTNASILQTGGTNHEYEVALGVPTPAESDCTFGCYRPNYYGTYSLSNGILMTCGTSLTANGNFQQFGGMHAINGDLYVEGSIYYVAGGGPAYTGPLGVDYFARGNYFLNGGILQASNIDIGVAGTLIQSNGAASITGSLRLESPAMSESGRAFSGSYTLRDGTLSASDIWMLDGSQFYEGGGFLAASNVSVNAATFTQDGGSNQIVGVLSVRSFNVTTYEYGRYYVTTNTGAYRLDDGFLAVSNLAILDAGKFSQNGGQLFISNVQLSGSIFSQTGGNIVQSGLLTLDGSIWYSAAGNQRLGQLLLGQTNSILYFPTNSCILQFEDSSGLVWSNAAVLNIQNGSGSLYGGGQQQIIFGSNSAALTPQQLNQIQFQNPAGLAPGNYPARILATGEIVPDTGAPLPPRLDISCASANGTMQLTLGGDIGRSYDIEVSTDLVNWMWWTNEINSNGTISVGDWEATNFPQRFYRARVSP
jgi:hypothetical protein